MRRLLTPLLACALIPAAEVRTLANPLGQDWPWELVSLDFDPGTVSPDWTVTLSGIEGSRPIQVEPVTVDGKRRDRVWFIATIPGKTKEVEATFAPGTATSSLRIEEGSGYTLVDNGLAETRFRFGAIAAGTPLGKAPHWFGGVRVHGHPAWDGRASFAGSSELAGLDVVTVATGPVFAEWRLTYRFADPGGAGTVAAVPLMLGKQSFRFAPNAIPQEELPREERRYEVAIRAIGGHPWIEVAERYRMPPDPSVGGFGITQYVLGLGRPSDGQEHLPDFADTGMPVDTLLWTRWFEYDAFGGNNQQLADPARPRAVQKGRPFAMLRPRWSQGPAGAQECLVTSGGATGMTLPAMRKTVADRLDWLRKQGERGEKADKKAKPLLEHLAQAQALFDQAGGEEAAERTALAKAADLAGMTIPAGIGYDPAAPLVGVVTAYPTKWVGPYAATVTVQAYGGDRVTYRFPLTEGGRRLDDNSELWYGGRCWALVAGPRGDFDSTSKIDSLIRRTSDWTLNALINRYRLTWEGQGSGKVDPNPSQYLGRRYQCDDVNPTNYGNRRLVNSIFEKNLKEVGQFGTNAAVCGYIYTDLDAWPGWHNGWGPGNPNFHTDKYMAAIYAAVTCVGHPDAEAWLAFGRSCLDNDLAKVMAAPDGVGYECPGYSGYSLGLQAQVAEALLHHDLGNALAENPLVAKNLTWHRKLLTPFDRRIGRRHEAPLGDTHRWSAGAKFADLIPFYQGTPFADELRAAQSLLDAKGPGPGTGAGLDWSSQAFHGFGAILRHRFGTERESFLSLKSGHVSGHYHNDDQSFHWYHRGTPIALDYNCSYHPRGDHAALHNAITLGGEGTIKHNAKGTQVATHEQPHGPARVVHFASTDRADLIVADRRITSLSASPIDPHNAEFNRDYPSRRIDARHRRLLLLTKQEEGSPFSDYLVLRDEIRTDEAQQVNLHLLAREARIDGDRVLLSGQWDQDILVAAVEGTDLTFEERYWAYADEWMAPPEAFLPRPGETVAEWDARLPAERPAADWKPVYVKREQIGDNARRWDDLITQTRGLAMMPPPGWTAAWTYGECQRWLRCSSAPGTPVTLVIYPFPKGAKPPLIRREGDDVLVIAEDGRTQRLRLGTGHGARLDDSELLAPGALEPMTTEATP